MFVFLVAVRRGFCCLRVRCMSFTGVAHYHEVRENEDKKPVKCFWCQAQSDEEFKDEIHFFSFYRLTGIKQFIGMCGGSKSCCPLG